MVLTLSNPTHRNALGPEMYAAGVEIDCQCARCGSSVFSERELDEDDEHVIVHICLSSPAWCEANPLPGRENVKRGEIEWFTFAERPEAT